MFTNCRGTRWFILGKYSNVVFTNNTNSEQCIETNLLEENECLTRQLIADSNLEENYQSVISDDVAYLESAVGVHQIVVPQAHMDILEQFEKNYSSCYVAASQPENTDMPKYQFLKREINKLTSEIQIKNKQLKVLKQTISRQDNKIVSLKFIILKLQKESIEEIAATGNE
ncbi:hypothetical protein QTP88_016096 [Uroleucon formosanum]